MEKALKFLTIDDQAMIIEFSRRMAFPSGSVILQQGDDSARAIYTILSGVARVEVNDVAIGHLGPGSLIGEMSFVDDLPASASVVAHTEVGVEVTDAQHLHTLLASVPGFAARFYKSLAALISERLRIADQLAAASGPRLPMSASRIQLPGAALTIQIPDAIVEEVDHLCCEMRELVLQSRRGGVVDRCAFAVSVAATCQRFLDLLVRATASQPDQSDAIAAHLFREAFPYFMTSRINEHAYFKPRGYDGDGTLLNLIRADREAGHGAFGAAVDRWVLDRPVMHALRVRGAWMMQSLREFTADWESRMPVPVTCLMTGTSDDVIEIDDDDVGLDITCLEMDPVTLRDVAERVDGRGGNVRISFVHTNLLAIGHGSGHTFLHSQKVIVVPDLLNRYDDETAAIHLLDWIYERLRNDGAVVIGQICPDDADRAYLEHFLRWHYHYRDQGDLERLFAASRFRSDALTFEHHAGGAQTKVICRRCH